MRKLHIDIETFSTINLKTAGLFKYASEVEILWLCYSYDDNPVRKIDVYNGKIPERLIADLQDKSIIKTAHNAQFEIACLSSYLNIYLDPAQWQCTMGLCAMAGLPLSLDAATQVLKVSEKDPIGISLIRLFSIPCKPTKTNNQRIRNLPEHSPEKWLQYGEYCAKDVIAEKAIDKTLSIIYISEFERKIWALDQRINNRGIKIDRRLVKHAISMDEIFKERLTIEAINITGLQKPNSIKALKKWLEEETNSTIENLQKKSLPKLIEQFDSPVIKRVLNLREQLSKTSVAKYSTMLRAVLIDGRIKGLFQYCGAGRTWRFAGRLVQLQNLVKGKYKYHKKTGFNDLDLARTFLLNNEAEMLELMYGPIPDTLSQLIRTVIIPDKGNKLAVLDFSAIEARILAWLSGEKWRMDVFNTHGKIYEASAAKVLKKAVEDITKEERDKIGKVGELAFGYAGGINAAIKFGALEAGLLEQELQPMVNVWRAENPNIVNFWYAVNQAGIKAINNGCEVKLSSIYKNDVALVKNDRGITFSYKHNYLMIKLPSCHSLYYYDASLVPGKYGVQIQYWGMDQTTSKWCKMRTYGGKLTENICQAIGRDCLVNGMLNLSEADYDIILHVHDEIAAEVDKDAGEEVLQEMSNLFCKKPEWMKDLPLKAEGFFSDYYKKD